MFATDELVMVRDPVVWPVSLSDLAGKYYVSCVAFPTDAYDPKCSYYLHSDRRWHPTTTPNGYFPDKESAEKALASVKGTTRPLDSNIEADVVASREAKRDYQIHR